MNILAAILLFSGIILFHEFGHYIMAKQGGICVLEFSLGMGPRLFSFVRGGTRYSLKLLPIGGSCMMLGEDEAELDPKDIPEGAFGKALGEAGPWRRLMVIAAGPVFNFILAFFCAVFLVAVSGYDKPVIARIMDGYPAQEAGLTAGDEIVSLNGRRIYLYRDLTAYTMTHPGRSLDIVYRRDGEKRQAVLTPVFSQEESRYLIGIGGGTFARAENPVSLAVYSVSEVRYWIWMTVESLGMLIRRQVSADDLSGPVRIVSMIGTAVDQSRPYGWKAVAVNLAGMAVLLSANLGVMNLLPIPALDGGRLVFIILELIRGKRVNPEWEARVHLIGFGLLMSLMLFVFYHDIAGLLGH